MDRREVEHVEAEIAHVRQPCDDVVEGAVPVGVERHRAREQLVPRRHQRPLRSTHTGTGRSSVVALVRSPARRISVCVSSRARSARRPASSGRASSRAMRSASFRPVLVRRGSVLRRFEEDAGLAHFDGDRHAGDVLLAGADQPGGEEIPPRHDRELVVGELAGTKTPAQRSLSTSRIGVSLHAPSGLRRCRSAAAMTSCPSEKMSASTGTGGRWSPSPETAPRRGRARPTRSRCARRRSAARRRPMRPATRRSPAERGSSGCASSCRFSERARRRLAVSAGHHNDTRRQKFRQFCRPSAEHFRTTTVEFSKSYHDCARRVHV